MLRTDRQTNKQADGAEHLIHADRLCQCIDNEVDVGEDYIMLDRWCCSPVK